METSVWLVFANASQRTRRLRSNAHLPKIGPLKVIDKPFAGNIIVSDGDGRPAG